MAEQRASSPVERAAEAKRARDLEAEVGALVGGHGALVGASWAPTRVGDLVWVTCEASGDQPRWTETYEVVASTEPGPGEQCELRLVEHTAPSQELAGWFGGPPEFWGEDAITTAWMEAGADRLAVVRDGAVVFQGRHALAGPERSEPRVANAVGADGVFGAAVVVERHLTPAEMDGLMGRVIERGAEIRREWEGK
ncbi:hypothetical protein ABT160_43525 [Streptomyces sp. NPDC001941]|uniref:hypothetical protein n=1 Tax=Streptomyces sp. NPDC001941 TaxID=3154659 RepID=UPI003331D849